MNPLIRLSSRAPTRLAALSLLAGALVLAGCGGTPAASPPAGHAGSSQVPTTTRSPSAAAPARLASTVAGWRLVRPVSRPVALREGGRVLLLGGLVTGDVSTADVVAVQPDQGSSLIVGALAAAVHDAAGAVLGGRALVFGGGTAASVATVQAWTSGTGTVLGQLPEPRSDVAAATVGSTAYVLGGYTGSALVPTVLSTGDGVTFHDAGTLAQPARYPAVTALAGKIWVIGGLLSASEANASGQTNDIQRFDPATGRTTVVGHLPVPLSDASAFVLDGGIYVAGGRSGSQPQSTIYRIAPATAAVSAAGSLPGPRSDAGVVSDGVRAWLLGGELSDPAAPLDSVVELTPGG